MIKTVRVLTCPVLYTSLCEPFPVYLARGPLIHHFSGYKQPTCAVPLLCVNGPLIHHFSGYKQPTCAAPLLCV